MMLNFVLHIEVLKLLARRVVCIHLHDLNIKIKCFISCSQYYSMHARGLLYSRRRVSNRESTGNLTHVAPSVLFGNFSKMIANLVGYMQVLRLSSRHARAPGHRRPCCKSLKAGCILKYNTQW